MIVDAFTYAGESRLGWTVTGPDLLDALNRAAVDRAVVCACQAREFRFDRANRAVADAVRVAPERLAGVARVDPLQGSAALRELERAWDELGLIGLLLHPWEDSFSLDSRHVSTLVSAAAERGLPVFVASGYPWVSEALQVAHLATRFPDARFVATNAAQLNIAGLAQIDGELLVARCDNVALVSNGMYRDDFLAKIVAEYGPDRLVFGSSFPVMEIEFERRRIALSQLDPTARPRVLGETIAGLCGWEFRA